MWPNGGPIISVTCSLELTGAAPASVYLPENRPSTCPDATSDGPCALGLAPSRPLSCATRPHHPAGLLHGFTRAIEGQQELERAAMQTDTPPASPWQIATAGVRGRAGLPCAHPSWKCMSSCRNPPAGTYGP